MPFKTPGTLFLAKSMVGDFGAILMLANSIVISYKLRRANRGCPGDCLGLNVNVSIYNCDPVPVILLYESIFSPGL